MLSLNSLRARILILVSVPLVFQLVLLGAVAYLQNEAEDEARRAEISRKISDEVIELTRDIFAVKSNFGFPDSVHLEPSLGSQYQTLDESIKAHFAKLRELTKGDLELSRALNNVIASMYRTQGEFLNARRTYNRARRLSGMNVNDETVAAYKRLRDLSIELSTDVVKLGDAGKKIADASPEHQRKFREQVQTVLIAGGVTNMLLTLVLGLILTRNIVSRLNVINDNSYRLASERPLNPPLAGDDEIARVDGIFHQMAGHLKNAAGREKAILESAYDCICSLDSDLRFTSANAASLQFFAVPDDEIVSTRLLDYLDKDCAQSVLAFRDKARQGEMQGALKLSIRRADGEVRDVLWSARWAAEEGKSGELFSIFHDVTEQSRAEQLRQEVVAMVTHDLRTPLMTVQSFLELLSQGFYGEKSEVGPKEDKSHRHLAGARRSCNRMVLLIRDLLDIEKIKSGKMEMNLSNVSAREVLEAAAEEATSFAAEMGVSLKVKPTKSVVRADEEMLQRVISNLVSNAIKFSASGGTVTLGAHNSGQTVTFSVTDEGAGIEPAMLKNVFDRFQQARNQTSRSRGGSGLGLTICKEIVQLHGGKIWVESTLGEGSQFFFEMPKG
ncbi:MAG TPA: ATP-binding protein [Candidatus Obscuribacter sp.]|nr:ATP-binding protein [Candidatus Obscuribacter sp.]